MDEIKKILDSLLKDLEALADPNNGNQESTLRELEQAAKTLEGQTTQNESLQQYLAEINNIVDAIKSIIQAEATARNHLIESATSLIKKLQNNLEKISLQIEDGPATPEPSVSESTQELDEESDTVDITAATSPTLNISEAAANDSVHPHPPQSHIEKINKELQKARIHDKIWATTDDNDNIKLVVKSTLTPEDKAKAILKAIQVSYEVIGETAINLMLPKDTALAFLKSLKPVSDYKAIINNLKLSAELAKESEIKELLDKLQTSVKHVTMPSDTSFNKPELPASPKPQALPQADTIPKAPPTEQGLTTSPASGLPPLPKPPT